MREENLIRIATEIIRFYKERPFARYLKDYFRLHKNMGSNDRRQIRAVTFNYFRLGNSCNHLSVKDRFSIAAFLCNAKDNLSDYLKLLLFSHSEFNLDFEERLKITAERFQLNLEDVFPSVNLLSKEIDKSAFQRSMFFQPDVFIRVRTGRLKRLIAELEQKSIAYRALNEHVLAFSPDQSLETLSSFANGDFEIQDLSSQRTGEYFHPKPNEYWWDACCASGGKSLLLLDQQNKIELFATDIRGTIVDNYKERLAKAGYTNVTTEVMDLSIAPFNKKQFDAIIADVPCSGSGTWSRSPEWLSLATEEMITDYSALQKKIVVNAWNALKTGGKLIYITCSVYAKENEENVNYFEHELKAKVDERVYLTGCLERADSLFLAVLRKH